MCWGGAAYITTLLHFMSETCSSQISYLSQNGLKFPINKADRQYERGRWIVGNSKERQRELSNYEKVHRADKPAGLNYPRQPLTMLQPLNSPIKSHKLERNRKREGGREGQREGRTEDDEAGKKDRERERGDVLVILKYNSFCSDSVELTEPQSVCVSVC